MSQYDGLYGEELGFWERDQAEAFLRTAAAAEEEVASLDIMVGDDQGTPLVDLIADKSVPAVDDFLEDILRSEDLQTMLSTLTLTERRALELRFGFSFDSGDGMPRTLTEVGKELGVTRWRMLQIEEKALRFLRHPMRSRKVRDYLG